MQVDELRLWLGLAVAEDGGHKLQGFGGWAASHAKPRILLRVLGRGDALPLFLKDAIMTSGVLQVKNAG